MRVRPDNEEVLAEASTNKPRHAERARPSKKRARTVLLALTEGDHPTLALQHSGVFARALEADLHIVQVLPPCRRFPRWGNFDVVEATRHVERCLAAVRETKAWCTSVLAESLPGQRLRIRTGDFIEEVSDRATELQAALIVLAPSVEHLGTTATTLAQASSRSVLVARTSAPQAPVLAATDLDDEEDWVLKRAVELGVQLEAPVVAIHNVSSSSMTFGVQNPALGTAMYDPAWLSRRDGHTSQPTAQSEALISAVMANVAPVDPVDAIIAQARAHHAQAIIVGTRSRAWLDRFIEPSLAAQVVNRSQRSVLVTPLTGPEQQEGYIQNA
jgi:nucleotide-binding universal stress UspA family protein